MALDKTVTGRIHSIEPLGGHDGPGLRTVVFFQGCPLRCIYCHNPDTWDRNGGEEVTVSELIRRILRYRPYFSKNGGVTFSGGEPLLQAEFAREAFARLKGMGIHTALDTAGSIADDETGKLLESTDLVLLDIKHADSGGFSKITGAGEEAFKTVRLFLDQCKAAGTEVILRQVVLPGMTDTNEAIDGLKLIAAEYGVKKIELLPYHAAGIPKWEALGLSYGLYGVDPPTGGEIDRLYRRLNE